MLKRSETRGGEKMKTVLARWPTSRGGKVCPEKEDSEAVFTDLVAGA